MLEFLNIWGRSWFFLSWVFLDYVYSNRYCANVYVQIDHALTRQRCEVLPWESLGHSLDIDKVC